ncbi:MAG: hypothetical protein BWZ09_01920 [Alphaproteobacteria bacterium ADurb.BinA305]|nr:MAG: hypothetical protein BWZ09_01920 [Alphaproteobacteria bacterium ADurb.BinA305]
MQGGGDLAHRGEHLVGARADLRHRGAGAVAHLHAVAHALHALLHGVDRALGALLDRRHHAADLARGERGALGELAHLVGHHREAAPGLARTGGLDRGVEREQVGLVGDVADRVDDRVDLARLLAELADGLARQIHRLGDALHLGHRLLHDRAPLLREPARILGKLLRGRGVVGDAVDPARHLLDRCGHAGGSVALRLGALQHATRGGRHLGGGAADVGGTGLDVADEAGDVIGHRIELARHLGELVARRELHAAAIVARGEALRAGRELAHRAHDGEIDADEEIACEQHADRRNRHLGLQALVQAVAARLEQAADLGAQHLVEVAYRGVDRAGDQFEEGRRAQAEALVEKLLPRSLTHPRDTLGDFAAHAVDASGEAGVGRRGAAQALQHRRLGAADLGEQRDQGVLVAARKLAAGAQRRATGTQLTEPLAEFRQRAEQRREQVGTRRLGVERQPGGVAELAEPAHESGDRLGVQAEILRACHGEPAVGEAYQRRPLHLPARAQARPAGIAVDCRVECAERGTQLRRLRLALGRQLAAAPQHTGGQAAVLLRLEDHAEARVEQLQAGDLAFGHADLFAQAGEDLREQDHRGDGTDEDDEPELERIAQAVEQADGRLEEDFHGSIPGAGPDRMVFEPVYGRFR